MSDETLSKFFDLPATESIKHERPKEIIICDKIVFVGGLSFRKIVTEVKLKTTKRNECRYFCIGGADELPSWLRSAHTFGYRSLQGFFRAVGYYKSNKEMDK